MSNRSYKVFAVVAILAILLQGCDRIGQSDGRRVRVNLAAVETRTLVTTTATLEASGRFVMNAFLEDPSKDFTKDPAENVDQSYIISDGGANVIMDAGEWRISDDPTWVAGTNTHFWCWHPVAVSGSRNISTLTKDSRELKFTYTMPVGDGTHTTDADVTDDLIFAYSKKNYKDGDDEYISIRFHHALSQIRFCVSIDDGTFDRNLTIKNITLSGLKNYGSAVFTDTGAAGEGTGTFVWSDQTGNATYGQDYNASFGTSSVAGWNKSTYTKDSHTYTLYTCTDVFFLVPQTLTSKAKAKIVFNDGLSDLDPVTVDLGTDEWQADKYYTYKIKATTLGRDILLSLSLEDWSDRDERIFIL